jgi:hypothetical protein
MELTSKDPMGLQRLREAKAELSSTAQTDINLPILLQEITSHTLC